MTNSGSGGINAAQFWLLNLLAVIALVLLAVDSNYFQKNAELRGEVARAQRIISQGTQLARLNKDVTALLSRLAEDNDDAQLRQLLDQVRQPASSPEVAQ